MIPPIRTRAVSPFLARRWGARFALLACALGALCGCGDDEDEDPVVAACESVCEAQPTTCVVPPINPPNCRNACELGAAILPDCKEQYAAVIECAEERPLLSCQGDTISVSLAAPECLQPIGGYVACAAANVLPACWPLPLLNAGCNDPSLPRAQACVGAVQGCELQTGAVLGSGEEVGIFCCS